MLMTTPCFPTVDIIPQSRNSIFDVTHSYIGRQNIPIKARGRSEVGDNRMHHRLSKKFSQINALKTGTDARVLLH